MVIESSRTQSSWLVLFIIDSLIIFQCSDSVYYMDWYINVIHNTCWCTLYLSLRSARMFLLQALCPSTCNRRCVPSQLWIQLPSHWWNQVYMCYFGQESHSQDVCSFTPAVPDYEAHQELHSQDVWSFTPDPKMPQAWTHFATHQEKPANEEGMQDGKDCDLHRGL